jgi:L-asparaginase II
MVAGQGRFDSDLMTVAGGEILSKGGAEGFQGIGVQLLGLGFALKITDGAQRACYPVSVEVLRGLNALTDDQLARLTEYSHPEVRNPSGDLVGKIEPVFSLEKAE